MSRGREKGSEPEEGEEEEEGISRFSWESHTPWMIAMKVRHVKEVDIPWRTKVIHAKKKNEEGCKNIAMKSWLSSLSLLFSQLMIKCDGNIMVCICIPIIAVLVDFEYRIADNLLTFNLLSPLSNTFPSQTIIKREKYSVFSREIEKRKSKRDEKYYEAIL